MKQTSFTPPPILAERLLVLLLAQEDAEAVLGDFAETFLQLATRSGDSKARLWYCLQVLESAPTLIQLQLSRQMKRKFTTIMRNFQLHNKLSLWLSMLALIPALLLVVPGIFQSIFGLMDPSRARDTLFAQWPYLEILINPIPLLGGLFLALILNFIPAIGLRIEHRPEGWISIITFKSVLLHWAFVGLSLLIIAIILIYAFFENFALTLR